MADVPTDNGVADPNRPLRAEAASPEYRFKCAERRKWRECVA